MSVINSESEDGGRVDCARCGKLPGECVWICRACGKIAEQIPYPVIGCECIAAAYVCDKCQAQTYERKSHYDRDRE
jgi:hypothetical protein